MAINTRQKRMAAINVRAPWRGPMVDASVSGFTQGNRQAGAFMYSGILAGGAVEEPDTGVPYVGFIRDLGRFMH